VQRWVFADNDRAVTERHTDGGIKLVVSGKGRVLGATIVGADAGELIAPWALAVRQQLNIGVMASLVLPYPTRSETGKRAAGSHFEPMLYSTRVRRLVRLLLRLG